MLSTQRVEAYTLQKAANLVMNVDGCIGALFLDLLHSSSMFTEVRSSDGKRSGLTCTPFCCPVHELCGSRRQGIVELAFSNLH